MSVSIHDFQGHQIIRVTAGCGGSVHCGLVTGGSVYRDRDGCGDPFVCIDARDDQGNTAAIYVLSSDEAEAIRDELDRFLDLCKDGEEAKR